MKPIFTIQDCVNYHRERGNNITALKPGDRFKTTKEYTGGEDKDGPLTGTVTGYRADPGYEVNNELQSQGFKIHEIYEVRFDSGCESVMWPDEIEALR